MISQLERHIGQIKVSVTNPFAVASAVARATGEPLAGHCFAVVTLVLTIFYVHQFFYCWLPNDMFTVIPSALIWCRQAVRDNRFPELVEGADGTGVWVACGANMKIMIMVSALHFLAEWWIRLFLVHQYI